tara:strand:+ start:1092 stop:1916 length:825 start_codon:yes stop_codon:yes gene_type:complete
MAQQNLNTGTTANDNTGDSLRAAMVKIQSNFDELYGDETTGEVNSITGGTGLSVDQSVGAVTVSLDTHTGDVTGTTALTIADDAVTYAKMQNLGTANRLLGGTSTGVISEVQVATDMIATDAVDGTKIADDAINSEHYTDGSIDTAHIADDQITHAKIENRYTAKVDITTYTGAVSIDWSTGTTFKMGSGLTGAIEFDFTNFKQGQVITFYNLTGSQTITFDSDAGTSETFNKVGAVDYDGSTTNMIQVECIDDSTNAIFNYSVAAYTSDTTPS